MGARASRRRRRRRAKARGERRARERWRRRSIALDEPSRREDAHLRLDVVDDDAVALHRHHRGARRAGGRADDGAPVHPERRARARASIASAHRSPICASSDKSRDRERTRLSRRAKPERPTSRGASVGAPRGGGDGGKESLSALRSSWVRWEIALARGARPAFLPAACSLGSPRPARFVRLRAGVRSARAPGADATPPTRPPFRAPEGRNRSRARVRGPAPRPRSASPARIGGAPIPGPGGASSTDRGIVRSP